MRFEPTTIPGCVLIHLLASRDERGGFGKTFHAPTFEAAGLRTDWREEFYSVSRKGVVRGMHFQLPPADHAKLVYCLAGAVLDVVVDLRASSPTQHSVYSRQLVAAEGVGIYVPSGCAHGFLSLTEDSMMLYKVTSVHAPAQDAGIAWHSIGFDWPVADAVLSARDQTHPDMSAFATPFVFDADRPSR